MHKIRPPIALAVAMAAAVYANAARAEWMGGEELEQMCTSDTPLDRGLCLSYVMGVLDGSRFATLPLKTPDDATGGKVRDAVTHYIKAHPDSAKLPARMIVRAAITDAWPSLQPKPVTKPKAVTKKRKGRRS